MSCLVMFSRLQSRSWNERDPPFNQSPSVKPTLPQSFALKLALGTWVFLNGFGSLALLVRDTSDGLPIHLPLFIALVSALASNYVLLGHAVRAAPALANGGAKM